MSEQIPFEYRHRYGAAKVLGTLSAIFAIIAYYSFLDYLMQFGVIKLLGYYGVGIMGLIAGFISLVCGIIGTSMKGISLERRLLPMIPLIASSIMMSLVAGYCCTWFYMGVYKALRIVMSILLVYAPLIVAPFAILFKVLLGAREKINEKEKN